MRIAPGDLLVVKFLELPPGSTAIYQVIAVYDVDEPTLHTRFWYMHFGKLHIYDAPVDVLDEKTLEVTVLKGEPLPVEG